MERIIVNGIEVPVRFSITGMFEVLESKNKGLGDLSNLTFLEILDICWMAVRVGCRRAGQENPFKSKDDFFDAIDDDTAAIERFTVAMNKSMESLDNSETEKNDKAQVKAKK